MNSDKSMLIEEMDNLTYGQCVPRGNKVYHQTIGMHHNCFCFFFYLRRYDRMTSGNKITLGWSALGPSQCPGGYWNKL